MDINVSDTVIMKKKHPCGGDEFLVMRIGMDLKLKCLKCGREFMGPRNKIVKNIKSVKIEKENLEDKNV